MFKVHFPFLEVFGEGVGVYKFVYNFIPNIDPAIGPAIQASVKDRRDKATAGFNIPIDPEKFAIAIPKSKDPPITIPLKGLGTVPATTAIIPNVNIKVPRNSPTKGITNPFDVGLGRVIPKSTTIATAVIAPANWEAIYEMLSDLLIFLSDSSPNVTAGFI